MTIAWLDYEDFNDFLAKTGLSAEQGKELIKKEILKRGLIK